MHSALLLFILATPAQTPADVVRSVKIDGEDREYHFHLPKGHDPAKPTPVVVVLHGAGTNGKIMEHFCGMTEQSDKSGFIVVYPNGTGTGKTFLTWNAGDFPPALGKRPDDIAYLNKVLDDLQTAVKVDAKRVYVAGMSNGGMMAYRCGHEMSARVAAIASVTGTIVVKDWQPKHPMPVLQIHGTKDSLVPFEGTKDKFLKFPSIESGMKICAKFNGCDPEPKITELPKTKDKYRVEKHDFGKGKNGAEVVLYVVEDGGHTWPGRDAPTLLGPSTKNILANEVIWEFFSKYTRE